MNPSQDPEKIDSHKPGPNKRLAQATCCLILLGAALTSSVFIYGCKRKPSTVASSGTTAPKVNPWDQVGKKLKKETDFVNCQNALRVLVQNLHDDDSIQRPASLGPNEERKLTELVPLSPADKTEIQNWSYSAHDAVYLADCLYLRDVAQSLKVENLTPEQLADIGFAWVCRSVALQPWLVTWSVGGQKGLIAAALPPTAVLRRGYGSALERMYIFLALLQQMDLEGCLIGPPGAKILEEWGATGIDGKLYPGGPTKPFWAVGVRLGSDIKIYDPWRGEAFPARFSGLKANPDSHKDWFEDSSNLSKIMPEDVKNATVYLAVPVNALAPRMEMLQEKLHKEGVGGSLKDGGGVRLTINPASYRAAFPDPKPNYWNPLEDRFAYGRAARTFLPRDLGGSDEMEAPRLYDAYQTEQLPTAFKPVLPELVAIDPQVATDTANQLFNLTRHNYAVSFLGIPNPRDLMTAVAPVGSISPRERIHRGFFQDAARDLIEKQGTFGKALETVRNTTDADEQIKLWGLRAKDLADQLGRTALITNESEKSEERILALRALEAHKRDPVMAIMFNRISAPICKLEATFLLCLCKHEEAERTQTEADYASGPGSVEVKQRANRAWIDARSAWRSYFEGYNPRQDDIPGRGIQARTLSARAEKFANQKP